MKIYKITIEETIVEEFEVEANNTYEAVEIAKEKYRQCEFVLSPGEVTSKQLAVTHPPKEETEWEEF